MSKINIGILLIKNKISFLIYRTFVFMCVISFFYVDKSHAKIPDLLDKETQVELAYHPYWLNLIHYKGSSKDKIYRSEINTPQFFLSPDGEYDPNAEMSETIQAVLSKKNINSDDHAQCRFRARYLWLFKKLDWKGLEHKVAPCNAYNDWLDNNSVDSLSLIFATGYLSNPASFYGHMLLRFNTEQANMHGNLVDISINYGAIIPKKENAVLYIMKGLFGGYEAGFTQGSYYDHDQNYGDIELRDVWEYRLNLDKEQVAAVVNHSWELLGNKFQYFYLKENCAYRIIELLDLVADGSLLSINKSWIPPVDLLKNIVDYSNVKNGESLVKYIKKIPSRQNVFYKKYYGLNDNYKYVLRSMIEGYDLSFNDFYLALSDKEKILIIDTLIDYYEIQIKKTDTLLLKKSKQNLLVEMLSLSSKEKLVDVELSNLSSPDKSQHSSMVNVSGVEIHGESSTKIQLRAAYFDFLNLDAGRMPDSQLVMADLVLMHTDNNMAIEKFDLVNIQTLSLPQTGLKGDRRAAWHLRFGWDKPDLKCNDCLVPSVEAGYGKAKKLSNHISLFAYVDGRLAERRQKYGGLAIGTSVGGVISYRDIFKMKLYYQRLKYEGRENMDIEKYIIEQRLGNSQIWDFRVLFEKAIENRLSIGMSYYF